MSDADPATAPAGEPTPEAPLSARERAARRRRLAEVFGDVLPEQTADDTGERDDERTSEAWLRRQVPPHHG